MIRRWPAPVLGLLVVVTTAAAVASYEPTAPSTASDAVVLQREPLEPHTLALGVAIRRGSTLGHVLAEHALPAHAVREAALPFYDLAQIRPDRELQVLYRQGEASALGLRYAIDEDRAVVVEREGDGFIARLDEVAYEVAPGVRAFALTRSLWQDGLDAGLRPGDLVRLARIFEYELDFNSELRPGARFSVVADIESAQDRERLGTIHAVRLQNGDKTYTAVRHVLPGDEEAFFHPDGSGMRRPFLRSPLEFSRVTSGFNPRRFHPILKQRRPHNGTDFGAPTGTPVRAVADAVVTFAGNSGGHGRFVKLDHEGPWETSYSHLHRIRVKLGERVRQGQVIGEVGATGLATGPHLHYQMWQGGKYVDPLRVALPTSRTLPAGEKAAFAASVAQWLPMLPAEDAELTR